MARNMYSAAEADYIRAHAGILSWAQVAENLGRTTQSVTTYASKNHIQGSYARRKTQSLLGLDARICGGLFCMSEFFPVRQAQRFCSPQCSNSIQRLKKYSLDRESWWEIFQTQGSVCVCGDAEPNLTWHIDHDHTCCPGKDSCGSCVRGILCSNCNLALGMVRDNSETLRKLADYLDDGPETQGRTQLASATQMKENYSG